MLSSSLDSILCFFGGILLISMGCYAVVKGWVFAGGGFVNTHFDRADNPIRFWIFVFIHFAFGVFLLGVWWDGGGLMNSVRPTVKSFSSLREIPGNNAVWLFGPKGGCSAVMLCSRQGGSSGGLVLLSAKHCYEETLRYTMSNPVPGPSAASFPITAHETIDVAGSKDDGFLLLRAPYAELPFPYELATETPDSIPNGNGKPDAVVTGFGSNLDGVLEYPQHRHEIGVRLIRMFNQNRIGTWQMDQAKTCRGDSGGPVTSGGIIWGINFASSKGPCRESAQAASFNVGPFRSELVLAANRLVDCCLGCP